MQSIYWNGEPCLGKRVLVEVPRHTEDDAPLAWWRDHSGQVRKAVEVHYYDQRHLLDDEDGSGWRKVTEGHGSPNYSHKSLPWDSERVSA